MNILTPGLVAASTLAAEPRPYWLDNWGRFAAGLAFDDMSPSLVSQAKLVLLDCVGAIAAGMQEPEVLALAGRMAARGRGEIAAIGAGLGLRGDDAAFLNGLAGTSLELDEGNSFARGHPGIHVLPAALATAHATNRNGRDLLVSFVLGYEIGARVGAASRLRSTVHPHGTWGTIGAAFATALLEGADAEQLIETINVASTLSVGASLRTMLEGATVRNGFCGFSNRNGMAAWDLVASGFTGEKDGVRSVYSTILSEHFRPELMDEELGQRFEIERNYFKRHAACRYTHAALDVIASLIDVYGPIDPEEIASIEVETYASAAQLDLARPANMLAARFSVPFAIATTIVNGAATVPAFRSKALDDQRTMALAAKVTVREKAEFTAMLPEKRPARVFLRKQDGSVLQGETLTNRGDAVDPYTPDEIRTKFIELAAPVWGEAHAGRILTAIETIESAESVADLNSLLLAPAIKEE